MKRSVETEFTNMCMVYDGKKILVQDRVDKKWFGITFPGGHIENGESFTEAVIREVYEETGLTIENPVLCGIKQWQNDDLSRYVVLFYKTNQFKGTLSPSNEGEVFWINKEDLKNYKLANDFDDMFKIFENDHLSEFCDYKTSNGWEKRIY